MPKFDAYLHKSEKISKINILINGQDELPGTHLRHHIYFTILSIFLACLRNEGNLK